MISILETQIPMKRQALQLNIVRLFCSLLGSHDRRDLRASVTQTYLDLACSVDFTVCYLGSHWSVFESSWSIESGTDIGAKYV